MRTALLIVLFSVLVASCESNPSPAPVSSKTPTPIITTPTAIPTREGAPKLDGEGIVLYHLCGQSGLNSDFNASRILAAGDMVDHINEMGGIFAAKVDLQLVDTAGDAELALSAYERITRLDEDILLLLLCDAATEIALADQLAQDELPAIGPGLVEPDYFEARHKRIYASNVGTDRQFAHWLDYLVSHWEEIKPLGAGNEIRLAIISGPEEESGVVSSPAALAYAAKLGVEIVEQISIKDSQNANLYDAVYASRDSNTNVIYIQTRGGASAELLNALYALGLRERVIVAGPSHAFESSLHPLLLNPSNVRGTYVTVSTSWWSDVDNPAIQRAEEIFTANSRSEEVRDAAYLSMLGAVDIIRRALENAILAVKYENLDADALNSALAQLTDYSVLDGLFVVNYSLSRNSLDSLQVMVFGEDPADLIRLQDFEPVPYLETELKE